MVLTRGNDPLSIGYQPIALPLSYASIIKLAHPERLELPRTVLETDMLPLHQGHKIWWERRDSNHAQELLQS